MTWDFWVLEQWDGRWQKGWCTQERCKRSSVRLCVKSGKVACAVYIFGHRCLRVSSGTGTEKVNGFFLAVKPSQISTGTARSPIFQESAISCAGMSCAAYEALFAADPHQGIRHLSLLPNLPCQVARGVIIAEARHTLHHDEHAALLAVLRTVAQVEVVDTAYFAIAGVIAGCAPAFAAQFIEALADAGVRYGLARDQAYRLAAHMLEGTAALIQHSGVHPAQLKDRVCSPAGSTIRGVLALEEQGLRRAVIHACRWLSSS
nr:1-pyrroline-5-carboxylate reductase [Treponema pallidum]